MPGELLLLTRAASPQFVHPITVRVIRHRTDWTTYDGWTWIECYQLDARGNAVERRELFLMPAGLIRPGDRPDLPHPATASGPSASRAWSDRSAGAARR
ncbi:hypothetical protein [Micromonospora sediminimaris]|uniref:Uncharacterized protein n=1 Tax=Micromonospora sediminimaris TaxID=547162 RepID=A0A9W5XKP8_9ACTN|nr:hypothetical protein [Micromonospora sediminimaris]GIJ34202.1 hypothetical protein Vse01_33500 [Micromonospora sediminimaris]SFD58966.1 hypothetical protein SAMN05216284_119113 [Micromonospora sediminimaris]